MTEAESKALFFMERYSIAIGEPWSLESFRAQGVTDATLDALERGGHLRRVHVGWTPVLPWFRRHPHVWVRTGTTWRGRVLPDLGTEAPHVGDCDMVPVDRYKSRCILCGRIVGLPEPPSWWTGPRDR